MDPAAEDRFGAVRAAYSARAAEYAQRFGRADALPPADRAFIGRWARGLDGTVLDMGCGLGQWTAYLARLGVRAEGMDPVPEFIDRASATYPGVPFSVGRAEETGLSSGSRAGVLGWYSLIHLEPDGVDAALAEFRRILRPGGALALGFFEGPRRERFDHAVAEAYFWPAHQLAAAVQAAGFSVTRCRARERPGARRHGEITAVRR